MADILVHRFERYFRHRDWQHKTLSRGDRDIACKNVWRALDLLGVAHERDLEPDLFDESLERAVKSFQKKVQHDKTDGRVGRNTRRIIIEKLLGQFGPSVFERLSLRDVTPSVFLSYARKDSAKVDLLDDWLRNHGVRVTRDQTSFTAGDTIPENVLRAVAEADKTVVVLSVNSRDRQWPAFERKIAEDIEQRLDARVLIYVALDNTPLPAHEPDRVAILAEGIPLKEVGDQILHALTRASIEPPTFTYDEREPM